MTKRDLPLVTFLINDLSLAGEPHGVMQLAAYAKLNDWSFSIITLKEDYIKALSNSQPQLIAASIMSSNVKDFKKSLKEIKGNFSKIPVVVGGPHATFVPESIRELDADMLVVGEGDYAFSEILKRISGRKDFENIDNVALKNNTYNLGQLVSNLDALPDIERSFVYDHYGRLLGNFKLKSFFTSRGCPYKCTYCFNHAYNKLYTGKGKLLRKRSVDRIIDEVLRVKKEYPMEYIRFSDDVFVLHADDWLDEFRRKFKKQVGISFYCLVRANDVNEDMVKSLKEAGCKSACMSIESGEENIRMHILGRHMSDEKIIKAFDLFNGYGINMYTNSMIGIPGTTINDDFKSLALATRCRTRYSGFTIITPYPGTSFYKFCESQNFLPKGMGMEELMSPTTGSKSVLTCFNEKEKKKQIKFIKLAPMAASFTFLRKFTVFAICYIPDNPLFDLIYWFTKNYIFSKYIVPVKFSFFDYIRLARRTLKEEMHQINKN